MIKTCKDCGYAHIIFHSCKNRSCPQCYFQQTQAWLDKQQQRLLPVHYFHVVFTLPSQFRGVMASHQKALYPVLFRAALDSLQKLALERRYVGGKLGITAVLHTWSGAMVYPPHIHCLIPGVGIAENGEVLCSRKKYLFPHEALAMVFRGKFLALARKAVAGVDFSNGGDIEKWHVFLKLVKEKNRQSVLNYLGRYLHRIAISNSSILKIEKEGIPFRYKKTNPKTKKSTYKKMTLPPMEFLRRFLQHVLPKGMAKVRYYGFMPPASHESFEQVRRCLWLAQMQTELPYKETEPPKERPQQESPCPQCGKSNWKITNAFAVAFHKPP